jgi:hypothetical protein
LKPEHVQGLTLRELRENCTTTMMKKPTHGDKRKRVGKESHVREKI